MTLRRLPATQVRRVTPQMNKHWLIRIAISELPRSTLGELIFKGEVHTCLDKYVTILMYLGTLYSYD